MSTMTTSTLDASLHYNVEHSKLRLMAHLGNIENNMASINESDTCYQVNKNVHGSFSLTLFNMASHCVLYCYLPEELCHTCKWFCCLGSLLFLWAMQMCLVLCIYFDD